MFNPSPALLRRLPSYPPQFQGRVPKMIRMDKTVYPPANKVNQMGVAWKGCTYPAWTDSAGNVSALVPYGVTISRVALSPAEFQVTQWFTS